MSDSRVASLAALLRQAWTVNAKHWKRSAEYLLARGVQYAPREPPGPDDREWTAIPSPQLEELLTAARFALKECEEITSCYPNAGDFWGLADNAAQELRRALAGEAVSAFAKAVCAPPQVDVERLNRAVDTMMEQAKNLREVLRGVGEAGAPQ